MDVPMRYRDNIPPGHTHEFHGTPISAQMTGSQIMQSTGHCPECHHATQRVTETVGIARYLPTPGQMVALTLLLGAGVAAIIALCMAFIAFALMLGLIAIVMTVMSIVVVILVKEMRRPITR